MARTSPPCSTLCLVLSGLIPFSIGCGASDWGNTDAARPGEGHLARDDAAVQPADFTPWMPNEIHAVGHDQQTTVRGPEDAMLASLPSATVESWVRRLPPRRLPPVGVNPTDGRAKEAADSSLSWQLFGHDAGDGPGILPVWSRIPPVVVDASPDHSPSDRQISRPSPASARRRHDAATAPVEKSKLSWQPVSSSYAGHWRQAQLERTAVAAQTRALIKQGFHLAERGALFTARAEFIQALRSIAQSLDAYYGQPDHTRLLLAALQALKEADDFAPTGAHSEAEIDVGTVFVSHRTPVLDADSAQGMPGVVAMQHYYVFAQDRLSAASGGAPAASHALFATGKIYMALADESLAAKQLSGPKAMVFHQAALTVDPHNYAAANELGVLLARFGQMEKARSVLQHSASIRPLPETWHNLSVVHQRLGEQGLADLARIEWQRATQLTQGTGQTPRAAGNTAVTWVDRQTFAEGRLESSQPLAEPVAVTQPEQAQRNPAGGRWSW